MASILDGQIKFHERRLANDKNASLEKRACYINSALLAAGGTVVLAFSTLMQFGPQFIMLASLSFQLFNRSTTNVANDTSAQVNAHNGNTVTV